MKGHTVDFSHRINRKRGKNLQYFRSLIPNPLTRKNNNACDVPHQYIFLLRGFGSTVQARYDE